VSLPFTPTLRSPLASAVARARSGEPAINASLGVDTDTSTGNTNLLTIPIVTPAATEPFADWHDGLTGHDLQG